MEPGEENVLTEHFGEYLRRERRLRNISLEEISNATKIKIDLLMAIEEARLDKLPPSIYVKGFLRAYSRHVGLDENDVILRYESHLQKGKEPTLKKIEIGRPRKSKILLWIAMASISLACIVYGFITFFPSHKEALNTKTQSSVKVQHAVEKGKGEKNETPERVEEALPPYGAIEERGKNSRDEYKAPIILEARSIMTTWIRYTVDKNPSGEVLLRPGEYFKWEARERLKLVVGNAGGVRFILNHKPMDVLGKEGEVVTLELPTGSQ